MCLNTKNEPILMGMVDTGGTSRIIYDRVEYALTWMDRVITGEEFRNVSTKPVIWINPMYTATYSISVYGTGFNVRLKLT